MEFQLLPLEQDAGVAEPVGGQRLRANQDTVAAGVFDRQRSHLQFFIESADVVFRTIVVVEDAAGRCDPDGLALPVKS